MKGVRCRVRRIATNFANDDIVSRPARLFEQIRIEEARKTSTAHRWRDGHPIDVREARIALQKPKIIRAVVSRILIESDQEGVAVTNPASVESLPDQRG